MVIPRENKWRVTVRPSGLSVQLGVLSWVKVSGNGLTYSVYVCREAVSVMMMGAMHDSTGKA